MNARVTAWLVLLLLIAGCASTPLHPVPSFNYFMPTRALAYSPDGELLLVLRERQRNELAIVDAKTLRVVRMLSGSQGHPERSRAPPGAIAFSPDGALVAVAGLDDIVTVWDGHTWDLLVRLPEMKWASGVVFLHDGITLATAGPDGRVRFWNARTGARMGELSGHDEPVLSIAISHDGQRLATGGFDRTARVWDVATRRQIAAFDQRFAAVVSLAFSVDGRRLATSADGYGALLWDLDWPRDARPPELDFTDWWTFARAVTPGVVVLGARSPYRGHSDLFCPLAMSADGKLLAVTETTTSLSSGSLTIYSMSSLSPVKAGNYYAQGNLAFSPDGRALAIHNGVLAVSLGIIDPYTGQELRKIELPK